MVQVIENRSDVRGRIVDVAPHPTLAQFVTVRLHVTAVTPVAGYPNLFDWAVGQEIAVNVAKDRADELRLVAGDEIGARIRMGSPQVAFAEPASISRG